MRVNNDVFVNAHSTGASFNSDAMPLTQAFGYSVQVVYTSTTAGAFKLQSSVDGSHWDDVPDSSTTVTTGGGSFTWNVSDVQYPTVRLVYTRTSGSGTATANLFYRGF